MQKDKLYLCNQATLTYLHGGQEIMMMNGEAWQVELEMFVSQVHVLLENIPRPRAIQDMYEFF